MKLDCPHCHKSMAGRSVDWMQLGKETQARRCRLCGGELEFQLYPVEFAVRAFTIVALVVACYVAKDRGGNYLGIVLGAALAIATAYAGAAFWLRDAQRYRRGRHAG